MTEACQYLHDTLSRLPRLRREDLAQVPKNGIYVLFENGERAHGGDRIVRIGTHRGQNNLRGRIREHLYKANKDRSIFRKHVGRCLLAKARDPFLSQWERDLTAKASRILHAGKVDKARLQEVEADVTRYMVDNFSFAALRFDSVTDRLDYEEALLSTIYHCPECGPSDSWLGKHHPTSVVLKTCGLWNVQSLTGEVLSLHEATHIVTAGTLHLAPASSCG
jgi:hypothetical protein